MEKRLFPEKQIMSYKYVNPKWRVWILNSYYIFYFFTYFQNHIFLGQEPTKKKGWKGVQLLILEYEQTFLKILSYF